jgi:hypothetical protein
LTQVKWEPLWLALVLIGMTSSLILLELSVPFLNWLYGLSSAAGNLLVLLVSIAIISLPFVPIELFFRKKHLSSSFFAVVVLLFALLAVPTLQLTGFSEKMAWATFAYSSMAIVVILFVIMLYFGFPFLRIIMRGGDIRPSDLADIIKRYPARSVGNLVKRDETFRQRVDFLMILLGKQSVAISEVSESVTQWVNEDAKQPQNSRYFFLKDDSISLTEMGESLAKALRKKLNVH